MTHLPPSLSLPVATVQAPPEWQRIDFISDLHLDASEPATFDAWANYMAHSPADALFILGDLFEVWVGDDNPDLFAQQCKGVLTATAQRMPVHFMCGNRDFLVGADLLHSTGMRGLPDPTLLEIQGDAAQDALRILLSHGDALCLDDHEYLAFRGQVRQPTWQAAFLSKPLDERQTYARHVRAQSEARKQHQPLASYADVDAHAATEWLSQTGAHILIHGHTHKPAEHDLGPTMRRWVLSDWHADSQPPRLEVLCWLRAEAAYADHGLRRFSLGT